MKVLCINAANQDILQEGTVYDAINDPNVPANYIIGGGTLSTLHCDATSWSKHRFEVVRSEVFPGKTTTEQLQEWKTRTPTSTEGVCSIAEFRKKYGAHGKQFRLLVEEFIARAPSFEGEEGLSRELGFAMADLEAALKYDPR